jgi:glycosyltransferase involved in cell wall biosynthesis
MIRLMKTQKIAFISSFRPRKCGIATFTTNLIENIGKSGGIEFIPSVVAMQAGHEQQYAKPVEFIIRKDIAADYIDAADYINSENFDAVSLQHEFGLFGAEGGSYISLLLKRLKIPVVTTLHTILKRSPSEYFNALINVCRESDKVIVMNEHGIDMLMSFYGVSGRKIRLVPHGIPDIPFNRSCFCKRGLSPSGRKIIMTFGLLGRNKGIEVMLRAMPAIIKTHPETLYIVLGATHPEVIKREGCSYRDELRQIVKDLKLQNHVIFHHRFVSDFELREFLCAADIYVTPYLCREQLTSGTLAFAVGAGKAVVSTPYWAAEELLAEDRGKLVAFGDSEQMASTIIQILDDDSLLNRMQFRAYQYGRAMTWESIGQKYWSLLEKEILSVPTTIEPGVPLRDDKITQLQLDRNVGTNVGCSMSLPS